MKATLKLFITLAILSISLSAHAELIWEQTELELHPAVGDETAVGHFKYQNKGNELIAITNVSSSCGCTAASTSKNGVAPGDKGEITATFQIGNRMGTQEKAITVITDDPAHLSTTLKLKVTIPEVLDFKPAFLSWQAGEPAKAKTIIAKVGKDVVTKNLEVSSSDPKFATKVERGSSDDEFRINVNPQQTTQATTAVLTLKVALPNDKSKLFTAAARVMPQSPPITAQTTNTGVADPRNQPDKAVAKAGSSIGRIDACALLTNEEIKSVQGEPFKDRTTNLDSAGFFAFSQCNFILPSAGKNIGLTVMQKMDDPAASEPRQFWKETFHGAHEKKNGLPEKEGKSVTQENVAGVGDEAFWVENSFGGQLYALKGNRFIVLSSGNEGDRASKIMRAKELAQMVLKRL